MRFLQTQNFSDMFDILFKEKKISTTKYYDFKQ